MKSKLRALMLLLSVLCGTGSFAFSAQDVALNEMSGKTMRSSDFEGKWIVFNYWAPWCHICADEIPELNNFYQHNRNPKVVFYGVDYDHPDMSTLRQVASKLNIHFPVLADDPAPIWKINVEDSVPVTYIINPKGMVAKVIYGPSTEQSLLQTLHELQR